MSITGRYRFFISDTITERNSLESKSDPEGIFCYVRYPDFTDESDGLLSSDDEPVFNGKLYFFVDGVWDLIKTEPGAPPDRMYAQSTENENGFDEDTYLIGSRIIIPDSIKVGTRYKFIFNVSKNEGGTQNPIINVRIGETGGIDDDIKLTLTFPEQTAEADEGVFEGWITFREIGAIAVMQAVVKLSHTLNSTGLSTSPIRIEKSESVGFELLPGHIIGLSLNGGESAEFVVNLIQAELENI